MTSEFDAKAAQWDQNPGRVKRAKEVAKAILHELPATQSALEFGCGTGLLSFALRPFADTTTLADTSKGMIETLDGKITAQGIDDFHAVFITEGAPELRGKSFDTIITLMVLHHIEDVPATLALFKSLLKPGGTLFIGDLEEEDGSFHGGGFSGHCGFNRASLTAQLKTAGFSKVHFQICHTMEKEGDGKSMTFPIFLATARA